jgi:AcrR family transcriptional regulator
MPRTKDSPQSRRVCQRLLTAAGEVFAERGYRAATVREITERAGANLAAINYHFRDKAELYASALKEAHASSRQILLSDTQRPPEARLRAFIESMLTYLLDPARPAWQSRLIARELAEPSAALDQVIEANIRPRCQFLGDILCDLAGAELPPEKLMLLNNSVVGQCLHYAQNGVVIERLFPQLTDYSRHIPLLTDHITDFTIPAVRQAGLAAKSHAIKP